MEGTQQGCLFLFTIHNIPFGLLCFCSGNSLKGYQRIFTFSRFFRYFSDLITPYFLGVYRQKPLVTRQKTPFSQVQSEIKKILANQHWQKYWRELSFDLWNKATIGDLQQFVRNTIVAACKQFGFFNPAVKEKP